MDRAEADRIDNRAVIVKNNIIQTRPKRFATNGSNKIELVKRPLKSMRISRSRYERPPRSNFLFIQMMYDVLHMTLIFLARLRPGSFMFDVADMNMVKLEKTLDWCIAEPDEQDPIVDRPLSWIFFIPLLAALKALRFYMSAISFVMGKGLITARDMKHTIMEVRGYMRSIKIFSIKDKRAKDQEREAERRRFFIWRLIYNLRDMVFMTKPVAIRAPGNNHGSINGDGNTEIKNRNVRKRTLDDDNANDDANEDAEDNSEDTAEDSTNNMTVTEMLDKYANLNENDDPDYEPEENQTSSEDSTSGEGTDEMDENDEAEGVQNQFTVDMRNGVAVTNGYHNSTNGNNDVESNKNGVEDQAPERSPPYPDSNPESNSHSHDGKQEDTKQQTSIIPPMITPDQHFPPL